jgi:ubiquinone/menaquinone biosynthesis C-methylase UbiE
MIAAFSRKRKLIKPRSLLPDLLKSPRGIWVELACGDGVFAEITLEIASPEIKIIGLDIDRSALTQFRDHLEKKKSEDLLPLQADLEHSLPMSKVDGIILANGLHFFPEQQQIQILTNCASVLKHDGHILIIEYNTERSTTAVPYRLPERNIYRLLIDAGFSAPLKISHVSSSYLGQLYSVLAGPIRI